MIVPHLRLQKPLEDYVDYLEKLNKRSFPLLAGLSAPALSFQDPYHRAHGLDEVTQILTRRFDVSSQGQYKVYDFTWGRREATAYIFWRFSFQVPQKGLKKKTSERLMFEGMSEVMFSGDGKIFSLSEFWGAHEGFNVKSYKQPVL